MLEHHNNRHEERKQRDFDNEHDKEQQQRQDGSYYMTSSEEDRLGRYGKPYSRRAKYDQDRTVVPVEIETSSQLHELVTTTILKYVNCTFEEWVNICYKERMKQILTDPKEFGELMLDDVRAAHGLHRMNLWFDD
jgi:hypothetical protein